jgi:GT2 family glycosyltransferase
VQKYEVPRNLGFARGVNYLLEKARGDILISLNDDTVVEPDWLAELDRAFAGDPSVGVVGCRIYSMSPEGVRTSILEHCGAGTDTKGFTFHHGNGEEDRGQFLEPAEPDYVTGAAIAFRRELYEAAGGLPECYSPIYYEENEYCQTAKALGLHVLYWPKARLYHVGMQASGSLSQTYFLRYHRNRIRFLIRNRSLRALLRSAWDELRWLLSLRNLEQYVPLFQAYLLSLWDCPKNWIGRYRLSRIRSRARSKIRESPRS